MNLDELLWVTGLTAVALAVVVLNDRLKKNVGPRTQGRVQPTALVMLIGVVVVVTVNSFFRRRFPDSGWLVPSFYIGVFVVAVVVVLRRLIGAFLKAALTGRFPLLIRKHTSGHLDVKCPTCSNRVPVTLGPPGETAFTCPHCGEKATWGTELKS